MGRRIVVRPDSVREEQPVPIGPELPPLAKRWFPPPQSRRKLVKMGPPLPPQPRAERARVTTRVKAPRAPRPRGPQLPRCSPTGHPYIMRDHAASHVDDCPAGMCVIYALVDPRDNTVRYIGKTEKPGLRFTSHVRGESTYNRRLASWIKNLWRKRRMRPAMVPIETVELSTWAEAERRLISFYRSRGRIFNIEAGGPSKRHRRA